MKEPIYPGNVGVIQIRLDLDLPDKLGQEVLLNDAFFLHHLQRYYKPRQLLHRHEHARKFPLPQLPDDLKTVNTQFGLLGVVAREHLPGLEHRTLLECGAGGRGLFQVLDSLVLEHRAIEVLCVQLTRDYAALAFHLRWDKA